MRELANEIQGRGSAHHGSRPVNLHLAMAFTCPSSFTTDGQGASLCSTSLFLQDHSTAVPLTRKKIILGTNTLRELGEV